MSRPPTADLLRRFRGCLASLRAAAEALELHRQGTPGGQEAALVDVVGQESRRLSELLDQLDRALEPRPRPHARLGPFLEELAAEASRSLDLPVDLALSAEVADSAAQLRLRGDTRALTAALLSVFARLRRDFSVSRLGADVRRRDGVVVVDLRWSAEAPELGRLGLAHGELLDATEPPLRATLQALGGEAWLTVDRTHRAAALHWIVPVA